MDASRYRASSTGSGARFPLPEDFFPPVACNAAQGAILQKEADKIVRDTVRDVRWQMHYEDSTRGGWKLASAKKHFRDAGVRTYTRRPDAVSEKMAKRMDFKCMGAIAMPLDQAMDAMYSDNTADCRHNAGTLIDGCVDAAVLHVIRKKSDAYPHRYLGINWVAIRNPGLFTKKRDMCYLKSTGTMLDDNNDQIGYFVMRSIDVKECAPMDQSHGLKRTNISSILLLKESADGRSTALIWQGTIPLTGSSQSKMLEFVHTNFMSGVANMNAFTVTRFLNRETDLQRYVSASRDNKSCPVCSKKFSMLRSRHHCHSCGQTMCRDCEVTRKATLLDRETLAMDPSFAEKETVRRYCKHCMATARQKADNSNTKSMTYDFTQSNISLIDSTATTPVPADKQSDRLSSISSSGSQCSIQLTWPDLTKLGAGSKLQYTTSTPGRQSHSSRQSYTSSTTATPTYSRTHKFNANLSTSHVPVSPLTIKTTQSRRNMNGGRERLETDPWEHYDAFEDTNGPADYDPETGKPSIGGHDSYTIDLPTVERRSSNTSEPVISERRSMHGSDPLMGERKSAYSSDPLMGERKSAYSSDPLMGERKSAYNVDPPMTDRRSWYSNDPSVAGRGSAYSSNDPSMAGRGSAFNAYDQSAAGRGSAYSNDGVEMDLAARLWEISRKAQETLDTTRRNSCMMSDTASAPRSSEHFSQLDRSIAQQADIINVMGFVSTGRVYMETGEDENGELSGVRVSETSIDEEERFEILT